MHNMCILVLSLRSILLRMSSLATRMHRVYRTGPERTTSGASLRYDQGVGTNIEQWISTTDREY